MTLTDPIFGGIAIDVDAKGTIRRLRRVHTPLVDPNGYVSDEDAFRQLSENAIKGTKGEDIDGIVFVPDPDLVPRRAAL